MIAKDVNQFLTWEPRILLILVAHSTVDMSEITLHKLLRYKEM